DTTVGTVTVGNLGVLKGLPGSSVASTAARLLISSGGKYQHAYTTSGGTIPTATWSPGSTCEIVGYASDTTAAGSLAQTFYNLTWNCRNQTGNPHRSAGVTAISGDLTMAGTGTGTLRYDANTPTPATLTIGGNLNVTGGTLNLCSGTAQVNVNLAGNLSI